MEDSLHFFLLLLLVAAIVSSATAAKHRGQTPRNEITEIEGGTRQAGSSPNPNPKPPLNRKPSGSGAVSLNEPNPKGPLIFDPAKLGKYVRRLSGSNKEKKEEGRINDKAKGKNLTPKSSWNFSSGRKTVEGSLSRNSSKTSSRTSDNQLKEEEIKATFESFDANNDGKITQEELGKLMTALGNPLDEEELAVGLSVFDTDGDGMISFQEFKEVFKPKDIEDLKVAFETFAQGKGFILQSDLIRVAHTSSIEMTPKEATGILATHGKQSGGQSINFSEFCKMMADGVFNE